MDIKEVKRRNRKLKIFWGKSKSQLSSSPGQMIITVIAATSRQQAMALLAGSSINVSRRKFFAWPEENSKNYPFFKTAGVWQAETHNPQSASDYHLVSPSSVSAVIESESNQDAA